MIERGKEEVKLTSSSFNHGEMIPRHHGRGFDNSAPSLCWEDVPVETRTFALVCRDPDALAGTWTHWVVYNIPAERCCLPSDLGRAIETSDGIRQGLNSWGESGYDGPQPPSGVHRYYFTLYALDEELDLKGGAPLHVLEETMEGHVLAKTELMGRFSK
jgi:Raf kinase inhibitor-like YbhB/YbcL family protein